MPRQSPPYRNVGAGQRRPLSWYKSSGSGRRWVALDADSKMVLSWRIGPRDAETAFDLMTDLAQRVKGRIQMTTDGYRAYFNAVEDAFGTEIDFATLHKVYASTGDNETRYSPAKIMSSETKV